MEIEYWCEPSIHKDMVTCYIKVNDFHRCHPVSTTISASSLLSHIRQWATFALDDYWKLCLRPAVLEGRA